MFFAKVNRDLILILLTKLICNISNSEFDEYWYTLIHSLHKCPNVISDSYMCDLFCFENDSVDPCESILAIIAIDTEGKVLICLQVNESLYSCMWMNLHIVRRSRCRFAGSNIGRMPIPISSFRIGPNTPLCLPPLP